MRSVDEQNAAALAKARGISLEEARVLLASATTMQTKRPPKGH